MSLITWCFKQLCDLAPLFAIIGAPYHCFVPPKAENVATPLISSTNPRYGQVAEASCCDVGWISAEHGGRCSWSVAKKTGSMYPCRRWSLWTLAVTLPAWHSSCHTSQLVFFRATNGNPRPALSRATNVLRNATLPLVRWKSFAFSKAVW